MRFGLIAGSLLSISILAAISGSALGAQTSFRKAVFARGFDHPVLLTYAPGERDTMYVLEQTGRVIRLRHGRRTSVSGHPRVAFSTSASRDFLDSPSTLGMRAIATSTSRIRRRAATTRWSVTGPTAAEACRVSRKVLFAKRDPYGNHNGGHLAFGPDRRLYTSIGDGGYGGDPENRSQNMRSQFGKLLALDVSRSGARWTIAGLGLRNPWRFSFDRATGDLYIGDVGQESIEEVSFTSWNSTGLENYGWGPVTRARGATRGVLRRAVCWSFRSSSTSTLEGAL